MHKLKDIFKVIRNEFRLVVPPLTATIDGEHHYEIWAEFNGKKTFFGKVIMHEDDVVLSFYPEIDKEDKWDIFAGDIFKRLDDNFSCSIKDLSPELSSQIKDAIYNLIDLAPP